MTYRRCSLYHRTVCNNVLLALNTGDRNNSASKPTCSFSCSSPVVCPLASGMATWNSMCYLNMLVILLFTCKVASGFPAITHACWLIFACSLIFSFPIIFSFPQSEIKVWVWYWVLYRTTCVLKSSAQIYLFMM